MKINAQQLNSISVSECSQLSEIEIQLREIPQDPEANIVKEITEKCFNGVAKTYHIRINDKVVGFYIAEIYGNEYVILAMKSEAFLSVFETLLPDIENRAKLAGCTSLTFNTVRSGLISKSINHDFKISSVVMRKTLK